jgi:hypothetical protein
VKNTPLRTPTVAVPAAAVTIYPPVEAEISTLTGSPLKIALVSPASISYLDWDEPEKLLNN